MKTLCTEKWEFWIDRGGTFTDVIARDPSGNLHIDKLLSENPTKYRDAATQGIRSILGIVDQNSLPIETIGIVKMGTTVATNALLERKGEKTLLVTTKGFRDILRIGYQNRPNLFSLEITVPEHLYAEVLEVSERVNAKGKVLIPLNEKLAKYKMQQLYKKGFRSVAIVLMHGYLCNKHEEKLAKIAHKIGYSQISLSHEVSPLIKIVYRGDTTVADAYLSPVIRKYVDEVKTELKAVPLMFMQSSGGMTSAATFQGKDSILSGPAGGVIAAVEVSEAAGNKQIIGFDMGGTSTDVFHYAGKLERRSSIEIGGLKIRSPILDIHTVAAGGGSKLLFDGSRFRVGPDSAGAYPGPSSYGYKGPLTLTDANVILGRIQPNYFPKVFGHTGSEPIDRTVAILEFENLAKIINGRLGGNLSIEDIAEGFLKVAVENMANAIKKVSVQQGRDIRQYTLVSFGGAGGQHACMVAAKLGIKRVQIHPLAGVLSAYGMGLANSRKLKEHPIGRQLNKNSKKIINKADKSLQEDIEKHFKKQDVEIRKITFHRSASIRYDGADTTLDVPLGSLSSMRNAFIEEHMRRFGFVDTSCQLIIDSIIVEGIGLTEKIYKKELPLPKRSISPKPSDYGSLCIAGKHFKTPIFQRTSLKPGHHIKGPAIIAEATTTTIVERGWELEINQKNNLILSRIKSVKAISKVSTKVDPIMLEIFNNLFMSVAEQMGSILANTARSINIKERLDFSCALFDNNGALIANAPHLPIHLGSMGDSVRTIIKERQQTIRPGQTFALNAPYNGGTHLPDITIVSPVFDKTQKDILFYVASRGHHADIGGISPGSIPPFSTSIDQEGILIDNFLIMEDGNLREKSIKKLLMSDPFPARDPIQNIADFKAQIAANMFGSSQLLNTVDKYGLSVVRAYMKHVKNNAAESVRRVIGTLRNSKFQLPLDHGGKIKVSISPDKIERRVTLDFNGTSPQLHSNFNAPRSVTQAVVLYVFRCLVEDNIPLNEGCLDPINIKIPEGCFLDPKYPAAVVAGNVETAQAIASAIFGATGKLAAGQTTMNNFTFGNDKFQYYETICGGSGAGPDFNGASAVHTHMTNTRITDPEVLEVRYPVLLEEFSLRHNSGGNGKFKGGDGVIRCIKFLEPMKAAVVSSSRKNPPFGLVGGEPGSTGRNYVIRANSSGKKLELDSSDETEMLIDDTFVIETPGGGGYGKKN